MTPEELKAREIATRREYPQAEAAFAYVRAAMVDALLNSDTSETEKRERLFFSIRALDEVQKIMIAAMGQGSEAIEDYIKALATTGE